MSWRRTHLAAFWGCIESLLPGPLIFPTNNYGESVPAEHSLYQDKQLSRL